MRLYFHNKKVKDDELDLKLISNIDIRPVLFHIIQYDELHYDEHKFNTLSELNSFLPTTSYTSEDYCTWINIDGIHRIDILDELSIRFNLHSLIKEDISTMNERMKFDLLDNGASIYLLLKIVYIHPTTENIQQEQLSIILKENNFLITFQETKDKLNSIDIFQVVKHRLKNNRGRIRSLKIDYLFYCLIDIIIENYMFVLDHISITIDTLDKSLMNRLKQTNNNILSTENNLKTLKLIYDTKHKMLSLRILCHPLREIIVKLQKAQDRISMANQNALYRRQYRRKKRPKHITLSGNYFFNPNSDSLTRRWSLGNIENKAPIFNEYIFMYFKDLNDHIIQLHDRIDTYCDLSSSLMSFYMILNDAEMNRIMTFLTLISVTFIPLMFLIGLFSVNFHNNPPLKWHYGYFCVLAALGSSASIMISFFKWKKWL
ncbi:unnamed protein product [Adineta steineri]|uniref:Uncharacterized protein n=1 Tax=Adineta steineri TaxID=433720 RepID=A0A814UC45_9BILA|nr:unnamed protein product [Adineta steineri]CAF1288791.1 unnamed protein product [Adineta steineri]CAF1391203.1 unnamed protein product [Adineta steineri]CAF3537910.1 unnamed protein product [Adineta steineri]CAF3826342.1 unnamed protein product [Adineta steineri]